MNFKKITVFGSGVLGAQIAFHIAFHHYDVTIYDLNNELLEKAKLKFTALGDRYIKDLNASPEDINTALENIDYSTNIKEAVSNADLAIEAIPEDLELKREFFSTLGKLAPEKTVFATNSSTLLPSRMAKETGRAQNFIALHFANEIWKQNTAEVMGHPDTDPAVFERIVRFAEGIGMVVIPINIEQPGYVLNSLLVPLLHAGLQLYVNEITTPEMIDKTWMIATGAPTGPFGILDIIGLTTAYNITRANPDKKSQIAAAVLKERFIDQGKIGVSTGEGFYTYPNPAYKEKQFLK